MNRGIVIVGGIIIGVGAIAMLVLSILLVQEKQEKQVVIQENNGLKTKLTAQTQNTKVIDVQPVLEKKISGFARPLPQV